MAPNTARSPEPTTTFLGGTGQDELAYSAYGMVLEITSRAQGSELCSSTIIPQMTVVADLTCSEDELSLISDSAVGKCHALRLPCVHMRHTSLQAEKDSGVHCMWWHNEERPDVPRKALAKGRGGGIGGPTLPDPRTQPH